jgi:hypothetical protein
MKLYETAAQIDAACIAFFKKGVTFQTEAHKLACSVLKHVGEHGDVRVVSKFIASFPELSRVNAVKAWFEAHGPVAFDKDGVSYVKGAETRLGVAMETPFWQFSPEKPYEPVNAAKALEALIKKLVRDAKLTGVDHSATITALRLVPVGKPVVQDMPDEEQEVPAAA